MVVWVSNTSFTRNNGKNWVFYSKNGQKMAKIANFGKKMPEKLSFLPENGVCTQILFVDLAEATFCRFGLKNRVLEL